MTASLHAERGRLVPIQSVPTRYHTAAPVHSIIIRSGSQLSTAQRLNSNPTILTADLTVVRVQQLVAVIIIYPIVVVVLAGRERILRQDGRVKEFLCCGFFRLLKLLSALFTHV